MSSPSEADRRRSKRSSGTTVTVDADVGDSPNNNKKSSGSSPYSPAKQRESTTTTERGSLRGGDTEPDDDDDNAGAAAAAAANNSNTNENNGNGDQSYNPNVVIDPTKDLWQNILANVKDNNMEITETNVLIVGQSHSGKSSLLSRIYTNFQGPADNSNSNSGGGTEKASVASGKKIKPTTALDYTFARRNDRNNSQVAHFFELAQGRELEKLSELIISPENIHNIVVFVVVDVSEDNLFNAFTDCFYWLKRTDERVEEIFKKMRARNSTTPEKMLNRAKKNLGGEEGNPDIARMRLSGVPIIVMVNKMDCFHGDTGRLKLLTRAFRYLAHLYGAHIVFTQAGEAILNNNSYNGYRALVSHILFSAPFDPKYIQGDCERDYVLLTANKDTFVDIGDPPIPAAGGASSSAANSRLTSGDPEVDRWRLAYEDAFFDVAGDKKGPGGAASPGAKEKDMGVFMRKMYELGEGGYGEPSIDALRKQKDEELEQYRKSNKKK